MKNYYAFRSLGKIRDYFGDKGPRVKISRIKFWWLKLNGYDVEVEESPNER